MKEFLVYTGVSILATQLVFGSIILLIGSHMMNFYEKITFHKPDGIGKKLYNIIIAILFGAGYFLYDKLYKFHWILRKSLFAAVILIFVMIHAILVQFFEGMGY
ncbi:hypothetical protein LCM20_09180 [Halobacillus litoralis]|uniref:hypothetical protein n=1 Tax=Halobacillus litoralis TaxID=45668 RepID=UPI001CD50D56|nr:hypothetical protein [Halobacillus litoralis]MCA0970760.1 hypothetical protein [Halobacillus litoralis]